MSSKKPPLVTGAKAQQEVSPDMPEPIVTHRPGPWRIDQSDDTTWRILGAGENGQYDNEIAELSYTGGDAEATAYLIEAAPDLLAACEEMLAPIGDSFTAIDWERIKAKAHAAISKARGTAVTA